MIACGDPITIENFVIDTISNSNWTEWSTIQSEESEAQRQFEITNMLIP